MSKDALNADEVRQELAEATRRELERLQDPAARPRYWMFGKVEGSQTADEYGFSATFAGYPDRVRQASHFNGDGSATLFAVGDTLVEGDLAQMPGGMEVILPADELAKGGLTAAAAAHLTDEGIEYVMDNTGLVEKLAKFLEGRRELPQHLLTGVVAPGPATPFDSGVGWEDVPDLKPAQNAAVRKALGQRVTFVWGPPGTGKTRTLAYLAAHLVRSGKRVLLSAMSNAALDQLFLRTVEWLGDDIGTFTVARIGATMREESRPFSQHTFGYREFRAKRDDARWSEWKDYVRHASLVAGNFSKLTTAFRDNPGVLDYAVVDEVSMANLPNLAVAICHAREAVVLGGDPMQLPPVAVDEEGGERNAWHADSVFDRAGVMDAAARRDPRVAFLDTQFRMQAEIGEMISAMFYDGELKTETPAAPRLRGFPARVVFRHCAGRVEAQDGRGRRAVLWRRNAEHARAAARAAVALRRAGLRERDIGIIAPYNAQVSLIHHELRRAGQTRIRVSTVHSFQGQESRAVILDLTDNNLPPSPLTADPRLINVALSRAQEQLVVIGNELYIRDERYFSEGERAMFRQLLERAAQVEEGDPEDA